MLVAALILVFLYWVTPDSPWSRGLLPWAFLTAAIACFLIFAWIVIYIEAIYDREIVYYLPRFVYDKGNDPVESGTKRNDDDTTYARETKSNYIVAHIGPLLMGILYFTFFWITWDWVKAHERQ